MTENLAISLQITLIGMSLVFGSIILLWIVMSLLMRFTADRVPGQARAEVKAVGAANRELQQRAAAAAVAIALACEAQPKPHAFPLPPTAFASAWQAIMRGNQLKQRGPVRKR